jgi:hypothetical protein
MTLIVPNLAVTGGEDGFICNGGRRLYLWASNSFVSTLNEVDCSLFHRAIQTAMPTSSDRLLPTMAQTNGASKEAANKKSLLIVGAGAAGMYNDVAI